MSEKQSGLYVPPPGLEEAIREAAVRQRSNKAALASGAFTEASRPLVPVWLVKVALVLGTAVMAGAVFLPEPWNFGAALFAAASLYLGGQGLSLPNWAAGRPLVPLALVPVLGGASLLLQKLAEAGVLLPDSWKPWVLALSGLLALAAGKVTPVPMLRPKGA